MDPPLSVLSTAIFTFILSSLVFRLLKLFWWKPASIALKLQQQGLPVLPYFPFLGNALQVKRLQQAAESSCLDSASNHGFVPRILAFYSKYSSKYGKSFVFWMGKRPTLLVTNADDVKNIMSTNFKHYRKSPLAYVVVRRMFGSGVLSAEGEDWENQRRILNPAFSGDKLKVMVADMSASALEMVKLWGKLLRDNGREIELDVVEDLQNVTGDIIARTCFGSSHHEGKAVFDDQDLLLNLTLEDAVGHTLVPGYRLFPTFTNFRCWKLERSIEKNLREIVETRIHSVKEGRASSYGDDLLGLILAVNQDDRGQLQNGSEKQNARLTTRQIMDECKTFFFAGHETSASLLSWTLMLLAQYPQWQERARAEVLEVCGKEAEPKADQLHQLRTVGIILNESLRLYPPAPQLISRVRAPDKKSLKMGQISIPHGLKLTTLVVVIHRDKTLWGEDADDFKPERFVNGISKACKHPHGFIPFGLGPHTCIGQTFAMMEAKVVIAMILQRFRIRLSPNYQHAPQIKLTLLPQHGMQLILECV